MGEVAPVLEVIPHRAGPWLVRAGQVQYAVPPALGRALHPLAGSCPSEKEIRVCLDEVRPATETGPWVEGLGLGLAGKTTGRTGRPIRFRLPLLPARVVRILADSLRPLAGNHGLTILTLIGVAGYLTPLAGTGPTGFSPDLGNMSAGFGLFLLSAFWHELGHATALARYGYPPGGIGAGILFVIPVLYADVTAVGLLRRPCRLRVDGAGVIFQLALGGLLMALASLPGCPSFLFTALTFAGSSALLAVVWSLFPFIRSDGYWVLCDMLGLDDLDRPPRVPVPNRLRVFLIVYQLANAVFLILVGIYFPWRVIRLIFGLLHRTGLTLEPVAANWLTAVLVLVFCGVMGVGLVRRVGTLVGAALLGLRSLMISR